MTTSLPEPRPRALAVDALPAPSGGPTVLRPGNGADAPAWAVHTVGVGLACCAVEVSAALVAAGATLCASPADGHVLLVSGTVTAATAPIVRAAYDALPEPRRVVAHGACTASGGPYWDSYSVTKGIDQLVPVDVAVPGCPPRPEALLEALAALVVPA